MIQRVMKFNSDLTEDKRITISMEFERPREALVPLMSLPDIVSIISCLCRSECSLHEKSFLSC